MTKIIQIKDIMNSNFVSSCVDTIMSEIVNVMQEQKVSSVLITQDEKPIGIITERDIVKASLSPQNSIQMSVTNLMSSPVHTINTHTDYRDAYMQMNEYKIRHLAVTNNEGNLVGTLSEGDFLNHLTPEQLLAIKEVDRVMSTDVVCCKPTDSLHTALNIMLENKIGAIVVHENNKALGLISESDALKFIQGTKELLTQPVKECMSSPVAVIHQKQTVLNAQTLMQELNVRRLVAVDDDENISGIISRHDLIKHIPEYYVEILRDMIKRQKSLVSKIRIELDEKIIFQNAVKALPHALVLMTQTKGIVQFVNVHKTPLCSMPEVNVGDSIDSFESNLFEIIQTKNWKDEVLNGKTLHKIIKIQHENSEYCYYHSSISAIFDDHNNFEGFLFIARDISEEQTLGLELKRLSSNLKEAYHIANIGNWELDAKTLEAYWSDEICTIVGLPKATKGGIELLKTLVTKEDFALISNSFMSALEKGTKHEMVYKIFPKDSTKERWVECRARRSTNPDGSAKSLIGTIQDVTQKVKSEQNIEHLNSLLKAIRSVNQLIVKEKDESSLLQAICDEVSIVSSFHGIWIFTQDRENKFYSAGFDEESRKALKEDILGGGFLDCCDLTQTQEIFRKPIHDCEGCLLAQSNHTADVLVIPIVYEDCSYGYIGFSVEKNTAQGNEEQILVREMASDIAFSLHNIDKREEYLKEQMRYKSLVEHSNDAIYMHTIDGVIIDANPTLARIHGCSKEELIGKNVKDFYQEDQLKIAQNHFQAIQEEGTISFEMELLKIDGTKFHAEIVSSLVEFDGEIVIQGSLRDVSKRYEAERQAQENELKMNVALEGSGHGIWDWDLANNSLYLSQQYKAMLGYTDDEIQNDVESFFNLFHPDDLQDMKVNIESFSRNKQSKENKLSLVFRLRAKDDTYKWILSIANIVSITQDGYIARMIGTITDISEQKFEEEKFKRIFDDSPTGIIYYDANGVLVTCNHTFADFFHSDSATFSNLAMYENLKDEKLISAMKDAIATGDGFYEGWYKPIVTDAVTGYGKAVFKGIRDADGVIRHAIGLVSDYTKQKKAEDELRLFQRSVESSTQGIAITTADRSSKAIYVNPAFESLTGYSRDELLGRNLRFLSENIAQKSEMDLLYKSIDNKKSLKLEIKSQRKDGSEFISELLVDPIYDENDIVTHFVGIQKDITELKTAEMKLDFLAYHDHLTELPNRTLLKARLDHTLSAAKRDQSMTVVMFLDLDNFKNINDSYGHSFGDELLVEVSHRIKKVMREDDTFARIGGDEFVIVMSHFSSSEEIAYIPQKIMEQFEKPFLVKDKELWISISLGISVSPDDGLSAEVLIKNADTAMYEAKGDGKNTSKFYNDKMSASSFERVVFENALKLAIKNQEFEVYYQPQEKLQDNSIIGFEALVRWNHPSLGIVSPDRFIYIAEETKMILEIGEFVLEQACKDIKKWHDEGLCHGRVAVNVSGIQLEHSDFSEILKHNLKKYNLDPAMIEIEVTESIVMKNPERWIEILEEIKRVGVSISIDDFGTGYSSLSYLRRLPVDTLKIDQSFIQDIPLEKDACAIVDAIINMAQSLGLNTLAEGVERADQRQYLVQKACKHAQGYLLSKPMDAKKTHSWLVVKNKEKLQ